MARITVEDCLQKVNNRFTVIHMASQRVRQLRKGAEPTISSKNRDVVVALREIAAGTVKKADSTQNDYLLGDQSERHPKKTEAPLTEQMTDDAQGEEIQESETIGD
ncbi:MAG: DNA-directed RNA polymerase subunit omega [Deltaproteobacteria bacterium]|nr:DNA-directed RNA polymerase subunit omega [Deltaproteobacteria bacterium]